MCESLGVGGGCVRKRARERERRGGNERVRRTQLHYESQEYWPLVYTRPLPFTLSVRPSNNLPAIEGNK